MKKLKLKIALAVYFIALRIAAKAAKHVLLNRTVVAGQPTKDFKPGGGVYKNTGSEPKLSRGEMVIIAGLQAPPEFIFKSDNSKFFNAAKAEINTISCSNGKLIQDLDRIRAQFKARIKAV